MFKYLIYTSLIRKIIVKMISLATIIKKLN